MPLSRALIDDMLAQTDHRPWPLPTRPWLMTQTWEGLLFAHWPVPAAALRALVPEPLALDARDGTCYIGLVPFWIADESLRGRVKVPFAGSFIEMNVRTYVTHKGKPGVYFISLDASNHVAVMAARFLYALPYYNAKMSFDIADDGWVTYRSTRRHSGVPIAEFKGRYRAKGPALAFTPGTLERWLTERYALYTVDDGHVYEGDIHHTPWTLHEAQAEIETNTTFSCWGLDVPGEPPLLHYAPHIDTVIWPLERV